MRMGLVEGISTAMCVLALSLPSPPANASESQGRGATQAANRAEKAQKKVQKKGTRRTGRAKPSGQAGTSGHDAPVHGALPHGSGGVNSTGEPDEVIFQRLDANRDGSLSRNEWNDITSEFDRLDFDRNGVLSPYEFGVGR